MARIKRQKQTMEEKLNTLRAGVLGSNDGILTVVGVLVSVAAATSNRFTIFIAGLSDLLACAFSMACGEYASVSTQRDTEESAVAKEERLLKTDFASELAAVQQYYVNKGVTPETSMAIAKDLLNKKPLQTMVRIKYDIELGHFLSPWDAAWSSLFSAAAGGIFPLMAMTFAPDALKWYAVILAVVLTSALTGFISSKLGNGLVKVAVMRNIIIALITVAIHYGVGKLF
ncbi:VIT1/CCC1 transporter family protein [Limosilactobacillus sp.]|jgi:VIT1/CCC1 family predicted Fe2+/Mn2+ transporter|uniref:VIT1/CCC1 transporter family protein n=1 Tax=Limosilactobacillus sp. TaxID=2773925 RepID=UPI0025C5DD83|nr:VIT family protein [Limosilactobacillus sp.]MCH3921290.1 VIT family protein [Limosilactobacillus sp.]MCH3928061.1 VIT family protein [Limosilactobacillus sp.]